MREQNRKSLERTKTNQNKNTSIYLFICIGRMEIVISGKSFLPSQLKYYSISICLEKTFCQNSSLANSIMYYLIFK